MSMRAGKQRATKEAPKKLRCLGPAALSLICQDTAHTALQGGNSSCLFQEALNRLTVYTHQE